MKPDDEHSPGRRGRLLQLVLGWFDSSHARNASDADGRKVQWLRVLPFLAMHVGCLAVIWVGWSPFAVGVAVALYVLRMFAITGFYHRYFSHRTFRTSRAVQFLGAVLGNSSGQRGPLWWAAHHREHHRTSDQPGDAHSPVLDSFIRSHMVWFMTREHHVTHEGRVPDLMRFPELRWLNRYDSVVPMLLGAALFGLGALLAQVAPGLGTDGPQLFIWGFCISTTVLAHGTFTINSLAHRWGGRPYETSDDSRNNAFLALITLGEGWHNNHHHYMHSVRQGFRWWEIDLTYMILRSMAAVGLVWDLAPVPARVLTERRVDLAHATSAATAATTPGPTPAKASTATPDVLVDVTPAAALGASPNGATEVTPVATPTTVPELEPVATAAASPELAPALTPDA